MKIVATDAAPEAIGPYSQAIDTGNILFCSGQIPLNPETMKLVDGDVATQTEQVFSNIKGVLAAAGLKLDDVVKTTVFLDSMSDFAKVNAVYAENFGGHKPARSTVEVACLPLNSLVEIECLAMRSQ